MTSVEPRTELLFSYGTLQLETVQMANFGRRLQGMPDALTGFQQTLLRIDDPKTVALSGKAEHPIARYTGNATDTIDGMVLVMTEEEMLKADAYEVQPYTRARVLLQSGMQAWAYVHAEHLPPESYLSAR